ncbi:hypothetical protein [Curtobacterium sp. NPDC092190]|uniref:hypothetical protein n=1 Tax=Curtobacterium sp. NPDC092190 TaxID=3363973 RepID=UPI00381384B4
MISVEAAGVLAQVIPVGLLVLAFESSGSVEANTRFGQFLLWVLRWAVIGSAFLALSAEASCIIAVASEVPLQGFEAVWVGSITTLLGVTAGAAILLGVSTSHGLVDALARRAMKDPKVRARIEKRLSDTTSND